MSSLDKYLQQVQSVTGYRRNLAQLGRVAGNPSSLLGSDALARHVGSMEQPEIPWGITTAAGLVAGGIIGAKHGHWALGAISGGSLFTNVPALLKPALRKEAFWNLAQTHGGVLASWASKDESPGKRAFMFALGYVGVGVARYIYGGEK